MHNKNRHINESVEVLVTPAGRTLYEVLGLIDQMRATGRWKEIHIDGESSNIVGVVA